MTSAPDSGIFVTRGDFAQGLTDVRRRAGLTVRDVARALDIPTSTVGGYFSGSHLPYPHSADLVSRILQTCGVRDPLQLREWHEAYLRVSDTPGRAREQTDGQGSGPASGGAPSRSAPFVSLRPPVERLAREPTLRGRAALMEQLTAACLHSRLARPEPSVHVLHGLGGCGKSTLALAVTRWAQLRGVQAWWICADEAAGVPAGMRALAIELGVNPVKLDSGSAVDLCWRVLSQRRRPWLLIMDNVDDPQDAFCCGSSPVCDGTGWLRPISGRYGFIIVTSRDGAAGTWGPPGTWIRAHRVDRLSAADGALVLRELAGSAAGTEESAIVLAARLGGLPLALRLAGLHIAEARRMPAGLASDHATFGAFLTALDENRAEDLLGAGTTGSRLAGGKVRELIGQTWELSLDLLERHGMAGCRPLLRLLACFQQAPIAYGLLLKPEILTSSALFAGLDQRRVWELVRALAGLGLVDLQHDPAEKDSIVADSLVLHPLVRLTGRQSPDVRQNLSSYAALLTSLLGTAAGDPDPRDPVSWPRWRAAADHCLAPLDLLQDLGDGTAPGIPGDVLDPPTLTARYLRAAGRLSEAARVIETALDRGSRLLPDSHQAILALRHDLARVWYGLGRWAQAESILDAVAGARRRVLGPVHPDTLTSMHYLGRVLRDRQRFSEAEALLKDTLRARRQVLGDLAPDTLTTLNNLADLRAAQGRLAEAEQMLRYVLKMRSDLLGDRYPATLVTRYHLASVRRDSGRPPDEPGLRALVADCHQTLGPAHPRSLAASRLLAMTLSDLGRHSEAENILRDIIGRQADLLGEAHPGTMASRRALAEVHSARSVQDRQEAAAQGVRRARSG